MNAFTSITLYTKMTMSPLMIIFAILIMVSSYRLRKKYDFDKIICITIFIGGVFMFIYGLADLILTPYLNLGYL